MRKLLLINPFNYGMSKYLMEKHNKESPSVRYGLLSIASYVKSKSKGEIEIKIIDYMSEEFRDYLLNDYLKHLDNLLKGFKPDLIGISGMFNFLLEAVLELGVFCKKKSTAMVFAGGPCAMAYSEKLLKEGTFDAICFFEGEIPILHLCLAEDIAEELETGKSWQTLKKLERRFQPRPEYVLNLDDIPTLEFDLLDNLEQYMNAGTISDLEEQKYTSLPIHTSRGCPFNCVFCASHFVHGKKMRMMSAERVIDDVKLMIERYKVNHLEICDDQFLIDSQRAKIILKGLSDLNLEVTTESGVSIFAIDNEIAYLMKQAGINTTSLALESGSEFTLKHIIDKPVKLEQVNSAIKVLKDNGINVHLLIVIGFPNETKDLRNDSMEFLRKTDADWFSVLCATPLKGSRLYDICVDKNYIKEDLVTRDGYHKAVISTEDFTAEEITQEAYMMNLELNFVNNYNLRNGNFELAYKYFSYVAKKFPFHAFAHYYLAKAMEGLRYSKEQIQIELDRFKEIVEIDKEWKAYAKHFALV